MKNIICCSIFILTTVFCYEVSDIEEVVKKIDLWTSYEEHCATLEVVDLGELCDDLKKLYKFGQDTIDEFHKLRHENILESYNEYTEYSTLLTKLQDCLSYRLSPAVDNFEFKLEELFTKLHETPKNELCNPYLLAWTEDIKKQSRKDFEHYGKSYRKGKKLYDDVCKNDGEVQIDVDQIIDKLIEQFINDYEKPTKLQEDIIDKYVEDMVARKRVGKSKEELEKESEEEITKIKDFIKEKLHEINARFMNESKEMEEKLSYLTKDNKKCESLSDKMRSDTLMMESFTLTSIQLIEQFANAKIFIVEKDGKRLIDCNEYVPYYGLKNGEMVLSANIDMTDVQFKVSGTDENDRRYVRTYTSKTISADKVQVREKWDWFDPVESTVLTYIYEY